MNNDGPAGVRSRGSGWIAGVVVLLALLLAGVLRYVAQPQRATRLVLDRAGNALGLQITASGGEYRLRGPPRIVVRDVVVREPGVSTPLLRADRIFVSLPWSTLRGFAGGASNGDLTANRLEIDRPIIALAALQHWLSRRPPSQARVPTLTDGMRVRDGSVVAPGWILTALTLDLPRLAPDARIAARIGGRYRNGGLQLPFALNVAMSQPASIAALGAAGTMGIQTASWRIPAQIVLSGMLRLDQNPRLEHATLAASARYVSGATQLPFALGMAGTVRSAPGRLALVPAGVAIHGGGLIPTLTARGTIKLSGAMNLRLAGNLPAWPDAWPGLPEPIRQSRSPISFALHYAGASDLTDVAQLQLQRDATRFDALFHLPQLMRWVDGRQQSPPLPPLDGRLTIPTLVIAGATLRGVEIAIDDPEIKGSPADR